MFWDTLRPLQHKTATNVLHSSGFDYVCVLQGLTELKWFVASLHVVQQLFSANDPTTLRRLSFKHQKLVVFLTSNSSWNHSIDVPRSDLSYCRQKPHSGVTELESPGLKKLLNAPQVRARQPFYSRSGQRGNLNVSCRA